MNVDGIEHAENLGGIGSGAAAPEERPEAWDHVASVGQSRPFGVEDLPHEPSDVFISRRKERP